MSIFNKIKLRKPKRSTFNLSHNSKLTFPWGQLIPTYWNYFEPNTNFRASSIIQCRTMPMLAPIMHEVNIYSYWFQVPIRILMKAKDYEDFITGGRTGEVGMTTSDGTTPLYPKYKALVSQLDGELGSLLDYMDFPTTQCLEYMQSDDVVKFDAIPLRALAKIWADYFRDQNTTEDTYFKDDSLLFTGEYDLTPDNLNALRIIHLDMLKTKPRCWTKDYFTSALPWSQRGSDVSMPFTVVSDLAMDGTYPSVITPAYSTGEFNPSLGYDVQTGGEVNQDSQKRIAMGRNGNGTVDLQFDVTGHTKVNSVVEGTINQLRDALSLQRWKERNAIGGARYIEQINAHFNVWADDYRLQRPKFLGGSRSPLQISEVLQTSESTETSLQGNMVGRGYTLDNQGNVHCFVKEHSIIMNIICVVPKAAYFQGLPRKFDIRDRFDFPWPTLAHLGEQPVRNSEIFYTGNESVDDSAFGYQSRYAQYKYEPNRIHSDFQNTLLFWNLARKFSELPTMSRSFLECTASRNGLNRIFPVVEDDNIYSGVNGKFWAQINFNIRVKRPLPYFGTPNL